MKIMYFISGQDGVAWYRVYQPAKMINRLKLAKIWHNPFDPDKGKTKDKEKNKAIAKWYDYTLDKKGQLKITKLFEEALGDPKKPNFDLIVFQRADINLMFSIAVMIRKIYNIPIVQEIDDYIFTLPGTNPAILAYKDKPIEQVDGDEDPRTVARISLGVFDSYIVSTPFLKKFYENYSPTYICPNSIDLSKRKQIPKKKHKDFRIMFSSSATHVDGARLLFPAIKKFLENYPDATFYAYEPLIRVIPEYKALSKRIKDMHWVRPDKYWRYMNSLSPDVCLAPATDVLFNRAKSNLRLLEYWTSGNNAVIASPVEPYKNTIIHGKNGLLAKETEDWYDQLEYLYKNPDVRERLGKAGYETVKKDFNLEKNARIWTDTFSDIINSYDPDREPPEQYTPNIPTAR